MQNACLQVSEEIVYRLVNQELIVVELVSGNFLYYTPDTRLLLDWFERPQTIEEFISAQLDKNTAANPSSLLSFIDHLIERAILIRLDLSQKNNVSKEIPHIKDLRFLRKGEISLEELNFFD